MLCIFFRMNDKNEEDGTLLFTIWLLLGLVGEQTHCVVLSPFSSAKHRRMGANFKFENCTKAHENVDFFSAQPPYHRVMHCLHPHVLLCCNQ